MTQLETHAPRYSMNHGRVLNLQRMSTEDGPGLRTTVFLKGCPLACTWCHNPESLSPRPQVVWQQARCVACGACLDACPERLERPPDPARCQACGRCVEACPAAAMEMLGREWDAVTLVNELLKDRAFFGAEGGVTLSGGEPTLQPAFAETVMTRLRAEGVHVALDTCGLCPEDTLLRLAGCADLILFDVKDIDPARHERFTGQSNARILQNLKALAGLVRARGGRPALWVRTPLIPDATAADANLQGLGRFLATNLAGVLGRWDLCAFNNLCREQYRRLGLTWAFADAPLMTRGELEHFAATARASGVDPALVHASGATRMEGS
jgi:pyruvate formate lyase activating enzyme